MDKIHINDIIIPVRYRKDYGDVLGMAVSISLNTLFNPIILTQDMNLNQGGRRLTALKLIYAVNNTNEDFSGLEHEKLAIIRKCKDWNIKAGFLAPHTHYKIYNFEDRHHELCMELEENIKRKDLDFRETAMLIKAIQDEKQRLHGEGHSSGRGWGVRDTAHYLGISAAKVSQDVQIAKAIENGDEDIASAGDRKKALKALTLKKETAVQVELQRRKTAQLRKVELTGQLTNLDALECLKNIPYGKIDHIITDPPYAIEFDKLTEGKVESSEYLEFAKSDYAPYMREFFAVAHDKIISGYVVCFCAFEYFSLICDLMEEAGFSTSNNPLIWYKVESPGKNHHPDKQLTSVAECAVVGWKGMPELNRKGRKNIFEYKSYIDVTERFHITQKPIELMRSIVETFSRPGDTIADLFMGSGSTIKAAIKLKRDYIGNDKSGYFKQTKLEIMQLTSEILAEASNDN